MVPPVSHPFVYFAQTWVLNTLAFFSYYKPADAPEDGIINAAKFFQKNGFPVDQVLESASHLHLGERSTDSFCSLQVGIQFIQVGNDPEAEQFLDELDTDLVRSMGEDARVGPLRSSLVHSSHQVCVIGHGGHHQV